MRDHGWVCEPCKDGRHTSHGRFTDTGADAGCPRALWVDGAMVAGPCACTVVTPGGSPARCPTCGKPS